MLNNQTTYQNQAVIRGLLRNEVVQYKSKTDPLWYDYNSEDFLNGDPFGPWNSADCYEWRVKPKTEEITLTIAVTVNKPVKFEFEGVKKSHYKYGEKIFYIQYNRKNSSYEKHTYTPCHDQESDCDYITFFETEEAMNKAYEQIINAQKGPL